MNARALATRLGRNDLRLILRDKLLATMLGMAFVMGVGCRYALPAIDASLAQSGVMPGPDGGMRFSETYPLFVTFIALWQATLLPGTVFGFLLLDEKEDDTLTAMRVTPVPMRGYLLYRVALPYLLGFAFVLALLPIIGLAPIAWWQRVPLALGAALVAPLVTLLLAMLANDKVQGLAYTKFGGVAGLAILIGWFVPAPGQWLLGLFPPFLICKAYWLVLEGAAHWWVPAFIGTAAQAALLWWVIQRFRAVAF